MINQVTKGSNGCGIVGFILSIVAIVLSFIKVKTDFVVGYEWIVWCVWCVATLLCAIGAFKLPYRKLAVAGLIICIIAVCVMYFVAETVAPV